MRAVEVIYHGAFLCSRAAARVMVDRGTGGRIVNVSSINAFLGLLQSSHYNTAKGAVDQLTRCLAVEWAPYGILVNGVAPGYVDTPMSIVDGVNELETEEFQEIYVRRRRIPLARAAQPAGDRRSRRLPRLRPLHLHDRPHHRGGWGIDDHVLNLDST